MDNIPTNTASEPPIDPIGTFHKIIDEGAAIDQNIKPMPSVPSYVPSSQAQPTTEEIKGEPWSDGATVGSQPPEGQQAAEVLSPEEKIAQLETTVNQLKQNVQMLGERLSNAEALLTSLATGDIDKQFASYQSSLEQSTVQPTEEATISADTTPVDPNKEANEQQQKLINDYLNQQ